MDIEQLKDASTPDEMRAEIFRMRFHNPMVHSVMNIADYRGLSAEDRYVILSYNALRAINKLKQIMMIDAQNLNIRK